jgi:hypothetical protein
LKLLQSGTDLQHSTQNPPQLDEAVENQVALSDAKAISASRSAKEKRAEERFAETAADPR